MQLRELKRLKKNIPELTTKIGSLEKVHKCSRAQEINTQLRDAKIELLTLFSDQHFIVKKEINQVNYWARALREKRVVHHIAHIKDKNGKKHITPEAITSNSELYNLEGNRNSKGTLTEDIRRQDRIVCFPKVSGLPAMEEDCLASLEAPLSTEEFETILSQLKPGKSPGADGLTNQYYRSFSKILAPHFTNTFNSIAKGNPIPPTILEAQIKVIPKPGKDASLCANYRPISLLNSNLKLYAKILANRMMLFMPALNGREQSSFIPNREGRDNTITVIHLIHQIKRQGNEGLILSMDAEKAFDWVAWDYMHLTLQA